MRVIIAGGRTRKVTNEEIAEALQAAGFKPTAILCGMAKGVDMCGLRWGHMNKIAVNCFPADWVNYGTDAGPRRNREMAEQADALLAFPSLRSPGTQNMIVQAKQLGLKVHVVNEPRKILRDARAEPAQ